MSTTRKIKEATGFQEMQDVLRHFATVNPTTKGVGSAQNSLIDPAYITEGGVIIKGAFVASAAASSSFYALEDTLVPAYGGVNFVCCQNAAGSGIGYATNVMTSAEISTAVADANQSAATVPATVLDANAITWPTIPNTMCPVAIYTVIAGSVSHVSGSSSFSLVTSAGGSHLFTQLYTFNKVS